MAMQIRNISTCKCTISNRDWTIAAMLREHLLYLKHKKFILKSKNHCITVTLCKIIEKHRSLGDKKNAGHTETAAIGFVIRLMASKPSLERRSFVWPGSGSMIGNLCMHKQQ